jgi:hypothetical protein
MHMPQTTLSLLSLRMCLQTTDILFLFLPNVFSNIKISVRRPLTITGHLEICPKQRNNTMVPSPRSGVRERERERGKSEGEMNGVGRQGQRSGAAGVHHQRQYSDNFLETSSNGRWLQSTGLQHLHSSNPSIPPLLVHIFFYYFFFLWI